MDRSRWGLLGILLLVVGCGGTASKIEIALKDLSVNNCPPGSENKTSISLNDNPNEPTHCWQIRGTAVNPASIAAKNVDIFGKIIDANGTPAVTRRRVGSLAQLPAGTSRFDLQVYLPAAAKPPFSLENMKAAGFPNQVDRR
ncbi:hypothetical protein [Gloeobacter kilaueensis]|uniref:Lipoprotein n=1 Tax=Gloeobacter kilaueensis (strain ATCC BAA-2537 / CCAP 1431/1 / ULC 316 / JS1) TaxID=1183438 RepID=U5QK91_GLOK1|nr:hypothetical protein [Gloeobacter kilaueensis]AGY58110.1 hypothetical protein GKIL_1864 [Gloeobacter kilaueensis JS1]